ncbi:MAG: lipoyl synthase, partial [Pseudomonadota bacterium]|nr:lipoyl synthase [Pseudomonadota bacterium]
MLGLGETLEEVETVMRDLRSHGVRMLTLGQYLQPTVHHLQVERYATTKEFDMLKDRAEMLGFDQVASGPLVRSSYHADQQAVSLLP